MCYGQVTFDKHRISSCVVVETLTTLTARYGLQRSHTRSPWQHLRHHAQSSAGKSLDSRLLQSDHPRVPLHSANTWKRLIWSCHHKRQRCQVLVYRCRPGGKKDESFLELGWNIPDVAYDIRLPVPHYRFDYWTYVRWCLSFCACARLSDYE